MHSDSTKTELNVQLWLQQTWSEVALESIQKWHRPGSEMNEEITHQIQDQLNWEGTYRKWSCHLRICVTRRHDSCIQHGCILSTWGIGANKTGTGTPGKKFRHSPLQLCQCTSHTPRTVQCTGSIRGTDRGGCFCAPGMWVACSQTLALLLRTWGKSRCQLRGPRRRVETFLLYWSIEELKRWRGSLKVASLLEDCCRSQL